MSIELSLPPARGPWSGAVLARLAGARTNGWAATPPGGDDPIADDDLQLALYLCYEQHYQGLPGVRSELEWDPGLLAIRAALERRFEAALRDAAPARPEVPVDELVPALIALLPGPSVAEHVADRADLAQLREYVLHRSAYQRKEGDPHAWAIPRLRGAAKQHLVRIQAGEYGADEHGGVTHAELFATTMRELGLDDRPNAYLDRLPATSLAVSNLASMFGLHRRHRAALVGHLALFETTSVEAMRRYVVGLERIGTTEAARRFFEVHVLADAEHEVLVVELLRALVDDDPSLLDDIAFGVSAALLVERRFAEYLLARWDRQRLTSLHSGSAR